MEKKMYNKRMVVHYYDILEKNFIVSYNRGLKFTRKSIRINSPFIRDNRESQNIMITEMSFSSDVRS